MSKGSEKPCAVGSGSVEAQDSEDQSQVPKGTVPTCGLESPNGQTRATEGGPHTGERSARAPDSKQSNPTVESSVRGTRSGNTLSVDTPFTARLRSKVLPLEGQSTRLYLLRVDWGLP